MTTLEDLHERIDYLDQSLIWLNKTDSQLWILFSSDTQRVIIKIQQQKDLYMATDRNQYETEKFLTLEAAKQYYKFRAICSIIEENIRGRGLQ